MFCIKCGKEIIDGSLFCGYCGTPLGNMKVEAPVLDDDTETEAINYADIKKAQKEVHKPIEEVKPDIDDLEDETVVIEAQPPKLEVPDFEEDETLLNEEQEPASSEEASQADSTLQGNALEDESTEIGGGVFDIPDFKYSGKNYEVVPVEPEESLGRDESKDMFDDLDSLMRDAGQGSMGFSEREAKKPLNNNASNNNTSVLSAINTGSKTGKTFLLIAGIAALLYAISASGLFKAATNVFNYWETDGSGVVAWSVILLFSYGATLVFAAVVLVNEIKNKEGAANELFKNIAFWLSALLILVTLLCMKSCKLAYYCIEIASGGDLDVFELLGNSWDLYTSFNSLKTGTILAGIIGVAGIVLSVVNINSLSMPASKPQSSASNSSFNINIPKKADKASVVQSSGSLADEIRELKKLLDDGLITEAEYEKAKKKALDK